MYRNLFRLLTACVLIMLCAAAVSADPLPAPRFPLGNLLKNAEFVNGLNHWTLINTDGIDKVKCNGVGHNSDCGFRFKGSSVSEATILKQVYVPVTTASTEDVVILADAYARSMSGTSCLKFTLKVLFVNVNYETLKGSHTTCGTNVVGSWTGPIEFGETTSFPERKMKKAVLTVKHTGIGEWFVDTLTLTMESK
ncbi:MAG: hypothetical protein IPK52_08430 [Chloroflexi bacterium]|nr:hypothetical protein [Chloroflexota bacterium]